MSLEHARRVIEEWRADYNEVRPHEALGRKTPMEYLAGQIEAPKELVRVQ